MVDSPLGSTSIYQIAAIMAIAQIKHAPCARRGSSGEVQNGILFSIASSLFGMFGIYFDYWVLGKMKNIYLAILLVSILSACQSSPGVVSDRHTGNTIIHSSRISVSSGLLASLHAQAVYSKRKGYGIYTEYLSTGTGWMFFREAWSFGKKYNYDVGDQRVIGCSAGCSLFETGAIRMSEQEFGMAAQNGFEFKLLGRNGAVEGRLPASAFKQVLDRMN